MISKIIYFKRTIDVVLKHSILFYFETNYRGEKIFMRVIVVDPYPFTKHNGV
jgi:energy-converting hydrogenase Eha subunit F